MNQDAEREIERLLGRRGTGEIRAEAMRELLHWAYADAAKVCGECREVIGEHRTGYIVRAIEDRAK